MHRKWAVSLIAAFLSCFSLLSAQAENAREAFCHQYADEAVSYQRQNVQGNCGYMGARWHEWWDAHHDWCLHLTAETTASRENDVRRTALSQCSLRAASQTK